MLKRKTKKELYFENLLNYCRNNNVYFRFSINDFNFYTSMKCFCCDYRPTKDIFNRLYLIYPALGYSKDNVKAICIKCFKGVYFS